MADSEELLAETEETLDDLIERLEGTTGALAVTVEDLLGHIDKLTDAIMHLNLPAAVAEVPAAAQEAVSNVGNAAGEGVKTVGEAATVPVAAAADVIEDAAGTAQSAGAAVTQGKRFSLRKARR